MYKLVVRSKYSDELNSCNLHMFHILTLLSHFCFSSIFFRRFSFFHFFFVLLFSFFIFSRCRLTFVLRMRNTAKCQTILVNIFRIHIPYTMFDVCVIQCDTVLRTKQHRNENTSTEHSKTEHRHRQVWTNLYLIWNIFEKMKKTSSNFHIFIFFLRSICMDMRMRVNVSTVYITFSAIFSVLSHTFICWTM